MCNKEYEKYSTKKYPMNFCSYHCYEANLKVSKPSNCECGICKKPMYLKKSRLDKLKFKNPTCSKECLLLFKKEYTKGENNHQYGLKGELNSSFKGLEIKKKNHNQIDIKVYNPEHPFKDRDSRVKKHRLIVEQNYMLFDIKYFVLINNKHYLKKDIDVHHIDHNHNNNEISNLQPLTRSEHTKEHLKDKKIIRNNNNGRIIGVFKLDKLLENPEEDNQQPI
jgi:hypothetical protein